MPYHRIWFNSGVNEEHPGMEDERYVLINE